MSANLRGTWMTELAARRKHLFAAFLPPHRRAVKRKLCGMMALTLSVQLTALLVSLHSTPAAAVAAVAVGDGDGGGGDAASAAAAAAAAASIEVPCCVSGERRPPLSVSDN